MTEEEFNAHRFRAHDRIEVTYTWGMKEVVELQQGKAKASERYYNPKTKQEDHLEPCLIFVGDDPSGEVIQLSKIASVRKL